MTVKDIFDSPAIREIEVEILSLHSEEVKRLTDEFQKIGNNH